MKQSEKKEKFLEYVRSNDECSDDDSEPAQSMQRKKAAVPRSMYRQKSVEQHRKKKYLRIH